jgi:hypothetical protein
MTNLGSKNLIGTFKRSRATTHCIFEEFYIKECREMGPELEGKWSKNVCGL